MDTCWSRRHVRTERPIHPARCRVPQHVGFRPSKPLLGILVTLASLAGGLAAQNVRVTTSPGTIDGSGSTTVRYELTRNEFLARPTDIMLVVDASGSVDVSEMSFLRNLLTSMATTLLDGCPSGCTTTNTCGPVPSPLGCPVVEAGLELGGGRLGIVRFSSTASLVKGLSTDESGVVNAILGAFSGGGSGGNCTSQGIDVAVGELTANSDPSRRRIALVITDGFADTACGSLTASLAAGKAAGIEFHALGIGNLGSLWLTELQQIAAPQQPWTTAIFSQLPSLLVPIVGTWCNGLSAMDVQLVAEVDPQMGAPTQAFSKYGTVQVDGQQVVWTIPNLSGLSGTSEWGVNCDVTQGSCTIMGKLEMTYEVSLACGQFSAGVHPVHADLAVTPASFTVEDLAGVTLGCPMVPTENLLVWGNGIFGQTSPPPLSLGVEYVGVAVGGEHVLGLRSDGTIAAWGDDEHGQLDVPALPVGVDYTAVSANGACSMALRSDGQVESWGLFGNAAVPALPPGVTYTRIAAGHYHYLALRSDGQVVGWGGVIPQALVAPPLPPGLTYVEVAAGAAWSMARRSDGEVVAFGDDSHGQLQVPALPPGVTYQRIAAGWQHGLAARSDGQVVAWGDNVLGQSTVPVLPPGLLYGEIAAGDYASMAFRGDGALVVWGIADSSSVPPAPSGETYVGLAAGGDTRAALTTPAGTWSDLGSSLAGGAGVPSMTGQGPLLGGQPFVITIDAMKPNSIGLVFMGLSTVNLPFKGGVLVPDPWVGFQIPTLAGSLPLGGVWPVGLPSGFAIFFQTWIADPAGPFGAAATNGLRALTP